MKRYEFKEWLSDKLNERPCIDCISRCRRVEKSLKIDLDDEYRKDEGKSLLLLLKYTAKDEREGTPLPDGLVFSGKTPASVRMGEIRLAVKKYFMFINEKERRGL